MKDLDKMEIRELQGLCLNRNLDHEGSKEDLIKRLRNDKEAVKAGYWS